MDDDGLAPARGCINGAAIGCVLWVAIFGGAALLVAAILR